MLTTHCACGNPKNPNAKQCMSCANEARRHALLGRKYGSERIAKSRAGLMRKRAEGWTGFDLAAHMRTRPHPFAKPVGSTRVGNGHIQIKCADGKWRYRARVMWEEAYGPIPRGQLVHHFNEDPFDDRLENFQLVTRAQHAALHATPERMRAQQLLGVAARKRNGTY